jgi:predicted acyl esterase
LALLERMRLSNADDTLLPGQRIMVQVQSGWFPLYDRNPQNFVPNIMLAKPADYAKATQRIWHMGAQASAIELPVISAGK